MNAIHEQRTFFVAAGTFRLALILLALAAAPAMGGCSSSGSAARDASTSQRGEVCHLNQEGTLFRCHLRFPAGAGADRCETSVTPAVKERFLSRMVSVSLEMLYLDQEPGASPPYAFNDLSRLRKRVELDGCDTKGGECSCLFQFRDPLLQRVLYDSAGCRYRSPYADNPLYFRGTGCGR